MEVMFTVRRIYFDQIVPGTKTAEVRRASEYWKQIANKVQEALVKQEPVVALFVCGRDSHRREIHSVMRYETAKEALGRNPSEQGKKDIGEGPVFRFILGDPVSTQKQETEK